MTGHAHTDPATCRHCGKPRGKRPNGCRRGAHGWCGTCTNRWYAAGKPATGVPPRLGEAERIRRITQTTRQAQRARLEDYADLRSWRENREQAAARVGVSERWARRVYDSLLAAGALDELAEAS